jgi:hypothetical protein
MSYRKVRTVHDEISVCPTYSTHNNTAGKKKTVSIKHTQQQYTSIIQHYDQQMPDYFTIYHTASCFDTIVSSWGSFILYYQDLNDYNTRTVNCLNCKLYYQQMYLKYLCNLARYWLEAPWGWHNSVETCRSVIICEIIVHLLVIVRNNKRRTVQVLK